MIEVNDYTEVSFIRFIEKRNLAVDTDDSKKREFDRGIFI